MKVSEFLKVYSGGNIEINNSNGYVAEMDTGNFGKYFGNYEITKIHNFDGMSITIADE